MSSFLRNIYILFLLTIVFSCITVLILLLSGTLNSYDISFNHWYLRKYTVKEITSKIHHSIDDDHTLDPGIGRVLLFFTTFPKSQHLEMIRECWPTLIRKSRLLSNSHVLVFLGGIATHNFVSDWEEALQHLPVNYTLRYDSYNPGYQEGAMRAAHELFHNGWCDGYDWVIRINPDVLIYDDMKLIALMNVKKVSAVLANCETSEDKMMVHTDFFAVRPSAIPKESFSDWKTFPNAENQATRVFDEIIRQESSAVIQVNNRDSACRIRGNGLWHSHESCAATLEMKPWQQSTEIVTSRESRKNCSTLSFELQKFVQPNVRSYVCKD